MDYLALWVSATIVTYMILQYGVFTLPDTETHTQTDKKIGCIELCGGAHTAQREVINTDSHYVL